MCAKSLQSCQLFAMLWTVALQAPLSMKFSREEYWNGLPFPTPGDLLDPGIKPMHFLHWQEDSLLKQVMSIMGTQHRLTRGLERNAWEANCLPRFRD